MNFDFSEESIKIIKQISEYENINFLVFLNFLKDYHCRIKKGIKYYKTKDGLTDYKLKSHDLLILLCLCKNSNSFDNKIEIILVFMYAYYKLDDFHFSTLDFKIKHFFVFLKENENIYELIYQLVTNKEFLVMVKHDL